MAGDSKFLDVYDRSKFATDLVELILDLGSPLSVGLDAKWGEGKTTFIEKIFKVKASDKNLPVIRYDCFEHERDGDPFVTIMQHILMLSEDLTKSLPIETKIEAIKTTSEKAARFLVGTCKVIAKAGAKTIFKQEVSEIVEAVTGAEDGGDVDDELASFIENKISDGNNIKKLKAQFQDSVSHLASLTSATGKIVVVIDELDRCRPSHAIDVLESIKHLLEVNGLVFVFTYHYQQLCGMVRHTFGSEIDANLYMHKFINIDLELPTKELFSNELKATHIFQCTCERLGVKAAEAGRILRHAGTFSYISKFFDLSVRDIERCVLFWVRVEAKYEFDFSTISKIVLIIWRIKYPEILKQLKLEVPLNQSQVATLKYHDLDENFRRRGSHIHDNFESEIGILFNKNGDDGKGQYNSDLKFRVRELDKLFSMTSF